ncbi:alanine:cation symporter family protein [Cobetia marina]|uniref:alanine/glycine:cation symporter family protein n=1 Tax=Cobetia TaxID=204286 RepID=UPI0010ADB1F5|nr:MULTISPECIES: sodium:alanine symporter family protein [Cobetia]MDH2291295.1 sodium:alanine symporter family protein [Cobetia sp. 10Alg 146]MDI6002510.1 sodium:alanine symporter family protein [Cobetia pacifica]MDN2657076.1 sodium:alanine symporter family protein [Cobetia sp. 14N.309.X.WAT.E.A4]MDO6788413.1 sodium:alanine symporter family protein [Cobetia marina]TKD63991.1 alanine:cation symporter family protein [Cobetia marina]
MSETTSIIPAPILALIDAGNGLLWGSVLIYLLIGAGLFFTVMTKGIQFRYFGHMWKLLATSRQGSEGGISSFQALATSLAARVGTGNLAGVAVAISLGGPGAIFWMWMTALVGMSTSFIESTLAQAYKVSHDDNTFRGGPAYYIEKGLGQRWMAILFSVCLIIAFGLAFNSVQSNSIALAMEQAFSVPPWIMGVILVVVMVPIIFGGMKRITRTAELIVPIMALLYLLLAIFVVAINITELPAALGTIFRSAFGLEQAAGGALGYTIAQAMMNGIKRGLFSNEAGMGSAPNAAAMATTRHPASQGFVQMLGVFIDTLVICTATAAIIIMSGTLGNDGGNDGIQITQAALTSQVGSWGGGFVAIAILLFAFTSLVANYSYGESNIEYISGKKNAKPVIMLYRFAVLGMVMLGAVASLKNIWNFADLSMGAMALINLIAILLLSPLAFRIFKDYDRQHKAGQEPTFDPEKFPELKGKVDPAIWKK